MIPPTVVPWPVALGALAHPERSAVVSPSQALSYGELHALVEGTAHRIETLLPDASTFVGLCLPRSWEQVVLILALVRARRVACLIHRRMPDEQIEGLLSTLGTDVLIGDRAWTPKDARIRVLPSDELLRAEPVVAGWQTFEADQPATVVYTSGSSGMPKAALLTLGNHYFNALGSNENIALEPGDRWLLSLPLYHVGGLGILFRCLLAGATVVIPEPGGTLAEAVDRHHITHLSLVSTQLQRLLEHPPTRLAQIKAVLLGGSMVIPALVDQAMRKGIPVHTTYGLTEMGSQVTTTPPGTAFHSHSDSGKVLPYREVMLAPDQEIWVRGATLFAGYVHAGKVEKATNEEGWFPTRDLGRWDADGNLIVTGRKDRMFISGGENIHPEEIERALSGMAGIQEVVVVPVPSDVFGHRPVAFIRSTTPRDAEDLKAALAMTLARFKIPDAFLPWPQVAGRTGVKIPYAVFVDAAERWSQEKGC